MLENEPDLGRYVRGLRRHRNLLAAGTLIGAAAGLGWSQLRPTLYEASTMILVMNENAQAHSASTSRALIKNYTLAAETLNEAGLNRPPTKLTPQQFIDTAFDVQDVPGTSLMKVRVRLSDPNQAAQISRILSRKAVELNRRVAAAESTSIRDQLRAHLDAAAERLKMADQQLLTYRNEAQLEVLKKDTDSMLAERGDLLKLVIDIEAEKARLAAAEQEIAKQERVSSVGRSPRAEEALRRAGGTADARNAQLAREGAVDAESLDLSNPFINPVYQTLVFQIATSRTRLAALERERREIVVVRKLGETRLAKLSELYGREIELARLQSADDLARRVYGDVALKYEQSRTGFIGTTAELQIVDEAVPPDRPLSRRRAQSTALGLTAGFILAAVAAFARDNAATMA